jgi:predicted secreted Zn-dependent protease
VAFLVACSGPTAAPAPTTEPGPDLPAATEVPASPTALPEERIRVEVTTGRQTYPVFGDTAEEIFAYIEANGPVDDKGQRKSGVTHYKARLEWTSRRDQRACMIGSMTIHVDLQVTLPALDPSSRLPAALRPKWNDFAEDVRVHEQRHVDIYLDGAGEIKERMLAIQPATGCSQLEVAVNSTWDGQQAIIDDAQERFDEDESIRIEGTRAPLKSRIDANRARLDGLLAQLNGLQSSLNTLSSQISPLKALLDDLKARMKAIEDSAPGASVPSEQFKDYESIVTQYNNLLPSFNALIGQYNSQAEQYDNLAKEAEALRNQTNQLVEQYNWAR